MSKLLTNKTVLVLLVAFQLHPLLPAQSRTEEVSKDVYTHVEATPFFRGQSKALLRALISINIPDTGNFNFGHLERELDSVEWRVLDYGSSFSLPAKPFDRLGPGENQAMRLCAGNWNSKGVVLVNQICIDEMLGDSLVIQGMTLHEGLEALGYDDRNYEITLSIFWLLLKSQLQNVDSAKADIPFLDSLTSAHRRSTDREFVIAAPRGRKSVTSVGSGGDHSALRAKMKLLAMLIHRWDETAEALPELRDFTATQMAGRILLARVESYYSSDRLRVWSHIDASTGEVIFNFPGAVFGSRLLNVEKQDDAVVLTALLRLIALQK